MSGAQIVYLHVNSETADEREINFGLGVQTIQKYRFDDFKASRV